MIPVQLVSRDSITQVARYLDNRWEPLTGDAAVMWDILQTNKSVDRLHKRVLAKSYRWLVWDNLTSLSIYLHKYPELLMPHYVELIANIELWLADPTRKQHQVCDQFFYDLVDPDDDEPVTVEILIENTLVAMGQYGVTHTMSTTGLSALEAAEYADGGIVYHEEERDLAYLRGRFYSQFLNLLPDDPPPVRFPVPDWSNTPDGPESGA